MFNPSAFWFQAGSAAAAPHGVAQLNVLSRDSRSKPSCVVSHAAVCFASCDGDRPAITIAGTQGKHDPRTPSPHLKRKRYAEETQDFINPEAGGSGTAPLQRTQGFVDPEAGGPGVAPLQCTQGFSTPPRRARTEMDFSPEAPSVSSAELRMGLQSLLQEKDKATEDPYLSLDAAKDIPLEIHHQQVGFSMWDVSEQVRCTFWLLYCISLLQLGYVGENQQQQRTVTNQALGLVARQVLSGTQATYEGFRKQKGNGHVRLDKYLQGHRVLPDPMTGEDIRPVEIPVTARQYWEVEIATEQWKVDRQASRVMRKPAAQDVRKKPAASADTSQAQRRVRRGCWLLANILCSWLSHYPAGLPVHSRQGARGKLGSASGDLAFSGSPA